MSSSRAANGEYVDLARVDPGLRDAAQGLAGRTISNIYEGDTLPAGSAHRGDPLLAGIGSLVRELRQRARARHGPAALRRHDDLLGAGHARRAVRVSDPVGSIAISRSMRGSNGSRSSVITALRFMPPGGIERVVRAGRRRRAREARSALAPGGRAIRRAGLRAHPRRHRPPAVPAAVSSSRSADSARSSRS